VLHKHIGKRGVYGVARQGKGRYLTLDQLDVSETQGTQVCARHV
jgi:hypothetical protein